MKAILSAPGSRGDVNPMIAIGKELLRRGHEVVISLAQPYASLALDAGLSVEPVISSQRFDELLGDPNVWKPLSGARVILGKVAAEYLPLHYGVIQRHYHAGETVLVSHPLDFASRVFREVNDHACLIDIHLAPCMLRTYQTPSRMTPWRFELSQPEWLVRTVYHAVDRLIIDPVIAGPVNQFRKDKIDQSSFKPVNRMIESWWLSPDKILAMYPDWFAPATKQFSPRLVHCGFPLQDIDASHQTPPENAPVAFTTGTAHRHSRFFFESAIKACQKIGCHGLLITTHPESIPESISETVKAIGYTSFAKLFPQCAAVVHHGGVGTTSQCLAAGLPQVIRPLAFDQFDHASRIEALGVGKWLRRKGFFGRDQRLSKVLKETLEDQSIANQAKICSAQVQGVNAITVAVDQIERSFRSEASVGQFCE